MSILKLSLKHAWVLAFLALVMFLCIMVSLYVEAEISRPWKGYQREFNALDATITTAELTQLREQPDGPEKEALLWMLDTRTEDIDCRPLAIKQLWLTDLGITDRCMTCHLGVESRRFLDAPQPFTTHPGNHLAADHHPVEKFGCVSCHDGQGIALTVAEAHAETDIWLNPILRGELAEASCRRCHDFDNTVPQLLEFPEAPHLTAGKRLYLDKGCLGCHVLDGFAKPQRLAPILNRVAEKADNGWLQRWIAKPKDYLPLTIMPFFDLKPEEIEQLGAYLNSLPVQQVKERSLKGNVQSGKGLFGEIGCLACHTVQDNGGTFGPDLNRVAEKIATETWLAGWLENPTGYDPETEMPNFRLADRQVQDLVAYLLTLRRDPDAPSHTFDHELADAGLERFTDLGCTGCHKVEGVVYGFPRSPEHTDFADKNMDMFDFGHVTDLPRTKAAWTKRKLEEPRIFATETIQLLMPDVGLTEEEIRDLRVWLLSLGQFNAPRHYRRDFFASDDPLLKGMLLVEKFNCLGCHKMGLTSVAMEVGEDFPDGYFWAAASYAVEDIEVNGELRFPRGNELSEAEVEELLLLQPESEDLLFRRNWFVDYDTAGYLLDSAFREIKIHGMHEGDILGNYKDLNFAPPILHYEGTKVQPNWLHEFLRAPYPVRPLTKATMPTFNLSEEDRNVLVAFFVAKDSGRQYFPVIELASTETAKAEQVFKLCLQCHYFDQERLHDKQGFGDLKGPNLAEAKRRLRPEYIQRWIKYPDLVIPGTQMKNFFYDFDIDTRFTEVSRDETGVTDIGQKEKIELMARFLANPFKAARLAIQR